MQHQLSAQITPRQPSKKLEKLIANCVNEFAKLNRSVNLALEQGRKEGFTDLEIGKLICHKLITARFSDRIARRYLPSTTEHHSYSPSMRYPTP